MANVTGNNTFNNISITGLDDVTVDSISGGTASFTNITTDYMTVNQVLTSSFQSYMDLAFANTLQINNNLVFGALIDGIDIPVIDNVSTPSGLVTLANRGKTYLADTAYTNGISNTGTITTDELVQTGTTALTIANFAFDTPVRPVNTGTNYIGSPGTITGWSFANISGTAPSVLAVGRGFWDTLGPNTLVNNYPDYPTVTQALSIRQTTIGNYRVSQSITVATAGYYLVSGWIWGRYLDYTASQTTTITFGSQNSGAVSASMQSWKKIQFITEITTVGVNTLAINVIQTVAVASTTVMTNFRITRVGGISARKTGTVTATNAILAETNIGIQSTGIYNVGTIHNYGAMNVYGALAPRLNAIINSMVIGDCKFGGEGQTNDAGTNTVLIGYGIGANISQPGGINANLTNVVALGAGAMEQVNGTRLDGIAIGKFACRYSACNNGIFMGTNAGSNFGYSGITNLTNNVVIGHYAMAQIFTLNNQYNCVVGNYIMGVADGTNNKSFNTIMGHLSGYNTMSNYHSVMGYNSFYNNTAVGSVGNSILGAQSANTSSGANTLKYTTMLGYGTDLNTNIVCENSTAIGAFSKIQESDTIEMGGANQTTGAYPAVVIPNKVKLQTNVLVGSVSTYNITFRTPENIIITNSITGTINLPTPTALAIGTRFTIYRGYSSPATTIAIQPQGGVNILYDGTTSSGFYDMGVESFITLVLVATTGNAWVLTGKSQINELPNAGYYPGTTDNSYFGTQYNNAGTDHTIMGVEAGMNLDGTSASNAFYGNQAGRSMTSGSSSVAVGQLALSENTIGLYNTAVGYNAGRDCKNTGNTLIGFATAQTSVLIDYCTAIGCSVAIAENIINSTGIGTNAVVTDSNTIVLGGALSGTYPTVIIPQKTQLQTRVSVGAVASYTITYPIPEVIILTSATTVTINLPTPQSSSVGASFYIIRAFATGLAPSITIQATAGINIAGNGVVANTYTYTGLETMLFVTLIGTAGTAWSVSGRTLDQNIADEIYAPQSTFNYEHYIDFSFQSATVNSYVGVNTDTELRYNPSLNRLSVPNILITDKQEIQTRVMAGAIASYSLTFPLPQELIIDSTTTTSVFLPSASTANIGASVSISRKYQVATNPIIIEVSAAATETIQGWDNAPGSNSIFMNSTITSMRCIVNAIGQWTAVYSRNEGQLQQSPMRINNTGTTTETIVSPFYKIYPFTCKAGAFIFNLPTLTAQMVGFEFNFKRAGGVYNAITFNPSSVVPTGVFGLGGTAFGTTGSSVLIGATQNSLTLYVSQTQNEFTGTFTNTAGATTITIVTLPASQAIFVGGYINLNGNFRYITADGGGRGGVGAYSINTAIAGANTGQPFTAFVSYGWLVMNQG